MIPPPSVSFEELLGTVPKEKRNLLDCQVESDRNLTVIAQNVTDWDLVLPFLIPTESAMGTEEAIRGNYHTVERRRLVTS